MATIRRRGTRWQVQIRRQNMGTLSRSFLRKADAEAWARQSEAALERGELIVSPAPTEPLTFHDLLERYARCVVPDKREAASERYRLQSLQRHPIAARRIETLSASAIAEYRDNRLTRVKPATVLRELAIIQHCLEIARAEWGIKLSVNPAADVRKPAASDRRERRLAEGELVRLRAALVSTQSSIGDVVMFAIITGLRRGEIVAARWRDLDRKNATLHVPHTKNGHPRTIPLCPSALAVLDREPGTPDEVIFGMTANAVRLGWERLRRRAGIEDLRFHDLRHEAISRFFELGLEMPEVALISGHRDPRMLLRYAHLAPRKIATKLALLRERDQETGQIDVSY